MHILMVDLVLCRRGQHVYFFVIDSLQPGYMDPVGRTFLLFPCKKHAFLVAELSTLLQQPDSLDPLASAVFFFRISHSPSHLAQCVSSHKAPGAGTILIERSCNLFDSIGFKDIILLHIVET